MQLDRQAYSVLMPLAPWEPLEIVAQAFKSLESQTLRPSQVLVSCDGEPSSSLRNLLKKTDLPLEIVVGPGGEGVGPVLARGLLHCNEELVLRADADDISLPGRAEFQVDWMLKHPKVLVMGTPIDEFNESMDRIICQRWVPINSNDIACSALHRNPINHPSTILRRMPILAAGNYLSIPFFEDYELWLRLLRLYGLFALANTSSPLVLARVGEKHLLRRHGLKYAQAEIHFLRHCLKEDLLPFSSVVKFVVFRLPLRLIPPRILGFAMSSLTRKIITSR